MRIIYAVPWIEVEFGFGQRDEGHKLFVDLAECIASSKESSRTGCSNGGYIGPERPLHYYEVPFDVLEKNAQEALNSGKTINWSSNHWRPKMKSDPNYIK